MKPTLVVMAAGMGSRYGGLKQIDPVGPGGEMVLDYSLFDAIRGGFGKVVFVIRRDIEQAFREAVEPRVAGRVPLHFVYQELAALPPGFTPPAGRSKPWGTGHAVLVTRGEVREPFGVINADDFYGATTFAVLAGELARRDPSGHQHLMVGFSLRNTLSEHGHVSRGVCEVDAEGRLRRVVEQTRIRRAGTRVVAEVEGAAVEIPEESLVSLNIWGFMPSIFAHLEAHFRSFLDRHGTDGKAEFFLPCVVDTLIQTGQATVDMCRTPDTWLGMTYPEDKPLVKAGIQKLVDAGVYPPRLWA